MDVKKRLFAAASVIALAAMGVLVNGGHNVAKAGPGSAPVSIVSPLPLPTTGTATVSGTVGATQSGAWNVGITGTPNVNVSNIPTVTVSNMPTVDVTNAQNAGVWTRPVNGDVTRKTFLGEENLTAANTSFCTDLTNGGLPQDFVIEQISAEITSASATPHYFVALQVNVPEENHFLTFTPVGTFAGFPNVQVSESHVQIYAPKNQPISLCAITDVLGQPASTVTLQVAGYLIVN